MKIGGIDPKTLPNEEVIVFPRGSQEIVVKARGLSNLDDFDRLCPLPSPPTKFMPDGGSQSDFNEPGYMASMVEYNKRRIAYIVVASLVDIEWETVNMDAPGTYCNWEADMLDGGMNRIEVNRIMGLALEANALDENKLRKARELFLRGPQPALAT